MVRQGRWKAVGLGTATFSQRAKSGSGGGLVRTVLTVDRLSCVMFGRSQLGRTYATAVVCTHIVVERPAAVGWTYQLVAGGAQNIGGGSQPLMAVLTDGWTVCILQAD